MRSNFVRVNSWSYDIPGWLQSRRLKLSGSLIKVFELIDLPGSQDNTRIMIVSSRALYGSAVLYL